MGLLLLVKTFVFHSNILFKKNYTINTNKRERYRERTVNKT